VRAQRRDFVFRALWETLLGILFAPLVVFARTQAAVQSADCVAELLARAQRAEDEGQPELARKLREYAGTIGVEAKPEQHLALSGPAANGLAAALPEPKKIGRPRKEEAQ
jgi:hypothetical protein